MGGGGGGGLSACPLALVCPHAACWGRYSPSCSPQQLKHSPLGPKGPGQKSPVVGNTLYPVVGGHTAQATAPVHPPKKALHTQPQARHALWPTKYEPHKYHTSVMRGSQIVLRARYYHVPKYYYAHNNRGWGFLAPFLSTARDKPEEGKAKPSDRPNKKQETHYNRGLNCKHRIIHCACIPNKGQTMIN